MRISAKICSPYEPCVTPKPSNFHRSTLRVTCPPGQYPSASAKTEKAPLRCFFSLRCAEGENIFAHKRENLFALRALCYTEAVKLPPEHAASNLPPGQYPSASANEKEQAKSLLFFARGARRVRTFLRISAKICSSYEPCATPKPSNSHRSTLRVTCPIGAVSLRLRQTEKAPLRCFFSLRCAEGEKSCA